MRLSLIHEDGEKQVAASNNESDEEDDDIGMDEEDEEEGNQDDEDQEISVKLAAMGAFGTMSTNTETVSTRIRDDLEDIDELLKGEEALLPPKLHGK